MTPQERAGAAASKRRWDLSWPPERDKLLQDLLRVAWPTQRGQAN